MTAVLFDVPGPRARARYQLTAVLGGLIVVAILGFVLFRFAQSGLFDAEQWDWITYELIQLSLLSGLLATLQAFAVGAVLALHSSPLPGSPTTPGSVHRPSRSSSSSVPSRC